MKRISSPLALLLGLVASIAAVVLLRRPAPLPAGGPERPPFALPVTLEPLARGSLQPSIRLSGEVRAPERTRMGFEVSGRLVELLVQEADQVAAGAVIARLDPRDADQALVQAAAGLELAVAELRKLEAGERAEVVLELEAQLAAAEGELELAELELARALQLRDAKVSSEANYDRARATHTAAMGRRDGALQRRDAARAGSRAEDIQIARARVATLEAELARAQLEREKTELRAPYDARVVSKLASLGARVQAGDPVYELYESARLEVQLVVPPTWVDRLAIGGAVSLGLDHLPEFSVQATLSAILPAADRSSRNFGALVRLDGTDPRLAPLLPGAFVRATVELEPLEDRWVVPSDALLVQEGGTFLVHASDLALSAAPANGPPPPPFEARWIPVRVLGRVGQQAAIESLGPPLFEGQKIVRTGVDRAFPGTPLFPAAERTAPGPGGAAPDQGGRGQ